MCVCVCVCVVSEEELSWGVCVSGRSHSLHLIREEKKERRRRMREEKRKRRDEEKDEGRGKLVWLPFQSSFCSTNMTMNILVPYYVCLSWVTSLFVDHLCH